MKSKAEEILHKLNRLETILNKYGSQLSMSKKDLALWNIWYSRGTRLKLKMLKEYANQSKPLPIIRTVEAIKLEWQKHNRDHTMSWNEIAHLVNEVQEATLKPQPLPSDEEIEKDSENFSFETNSKSELEVKFYDAGLEFMKIGFRLGMKRMRDNYQPKNYVCKNCKGEGWVISKNEQESHPCPACGGTKTNQPKQKILTLKEANELLKGKHPDIYDYPNSVPDQPKQERKTCCNNPILEVGAIPEHRYCKSYGEDWDIKSKQIDLKELEKEYYKKFTRNGECKSFSHSPRQVFNWFLKKSNKN